MNLCFATFEYIFLLNDYAWMRYCGGDLLSGNIRSPSYPSLLYFSILLFVTTGSRGFDEPRSKMWYTYALILMRERDEL